LEGPGAGTISLIHFRKEKDRLDRLAKDSEVGRLTKGGPREGEVDIVELHGKESKKRKSNPLIPLKQKRTTTIWNYEPRPRLRRKKD